MDENKITSLVENIEIFLETSSKNNEKIIKTLNDLKNDPKSAQILTQSFEKHNLLLNEFSGLISKQKQQIENFKPIVESKQYSINVKQPLWWIMGAISVMLICFIVCFLFWEKNRILEKQVETLQHSDYLLKYFKFGSFTLQDLDKSSIKTSADIVQGLEGRYVEDPKYFIEYVTKKERDLKRAEEAEALAKLKQSKAKEDIEEAEKLKKQADSLKNK